MTAPGPRNVHVFPADDPVGHDMDGDACTCGPTVEHLPSGRWLFTHHSLDGRELNEAES